MYEKVHFFCSLPQELFQPPPSSSVCWTHDLLDCHCQEDSGDAEEVEALDEATSTEDHRTFQLGKRPKMESGVTTSSCKGLGQIKSWRHFLNPAAINEVVALTTASRHVRAVFQYTTTSSI